SLGDVRIAALSSMAHVPAGASTSASAAGASMPSIAPAGPVAQAASQSHLFEALLGVFQQIARERPLLLVIEDLHWADPATRDAIAVLVPKLAADRVGLCLTYRTDEIDRRYPLLPWLAEVARTGSFERINLEGVDRAEDGPLALGVHTARP